MKAGIARRAIGTVVLMLAGWQVGSLIGGDRAAQPRNAVLGIAIGAVLGFLAAPLLVTGPYMALRRRIARTPPLDLFYALSGLILGLVVAALASYPLSLLPWWFGRFLPAVTCVICVYLGINLIMQLRPQLTQLLNTGGPSSEVSTRVSVQSSLLDTSAIIDGRIADIAETGFLPGVVIVPRFVLIELQHIAGSSDDLRRARGRRGLEILNRMQKQSWTVVTFSDLDARDVHEVDGKLVKLARDHGYAVITNDFNLNRVAELQGVRVLNINQLANAVRSVVLPGEEMEIHIIQEGKEMNQGIGYLDDGTMIVVENGRRHLHHQVPVVVTRVLQTVAGRMIFAQPKANGRA